MHSAPPPSDINANNPYLAGPYRPVIKESCFDDLEVIGEIPRDLFGVYLRNGPNPKFQPRDRYHWFDGDGMLHAVYFENGRARYRNKWVRTANFDEEQRAGKSLWSGLMCSTTENPKHAPYKDTANTDVTAFGAEALVTWYICGHPYRIDPLTLETRGPHTFGAARPRRISAHTKVDAVTGELMFFEYGLAPRLTYGVVNRSGTIVHETQIPLPGPRLPHDMAITKNYSILMDLPVFFTEKALRERRWRVDYHRDLPARFAVIPRHGAADNVRWFDAEPCYVYHTVNAWEDGDTIVMVGCKTDDPVPKPDVERDGSFAGMMATLRLKSYLYEWRFDLRTGTCRERQLDDHSTEFPSMNLGRLGRPARYTYNVGIPDTPTLTFDSIVKYDVLTGAMQRHNFGPGRFGSEAPFAPVHGGDGTAPDGSDTLDDTEDDGYVLSFVRDERHDRSEVVILDAKDIGRGPLARVQIPQRVPNGFHACWMPGAQLTTAD